MLYVYIEEYHHSATFSRPLSVQMCLGPQIEMFNSNEKLRGEFSRDRD